MIGWISVLCLIHFLGCLASDGLYFFRFWPFVNNIFTTSKIDRGIEKEKINKS